ncbi:PREDICTED: dopamine N-acetyltransferase-like [Polistes canadensis]|uniref:dopamine N-acetyltransferase-like n=1 Tax=Polistes canadensis TaxID=91411 RepID=UPI000719070A|nr:PREDICTED: dopamine N-acetyltransferase-like [Polistes canadensis]KAI4487474.1 hypothetical protein M0804_005623 [Polistes exclamans]
MVSLLSRLITNATTFQCAKLFRSIEKLRYSQSRFNASKKSTDYITRLAMPIDYENVLSLMCGTYFRHEATMINIGISEDPPLTSMINLTLELMKHGMTIIAENSDHYIIGAAINICSCPWDPKKMMEYARRSEEKGPIRDLIEFFAYVSSKPDVWNRYCVHKVFECSNVAVDPEYRGMGIAKKLMEESWYLARDCSYRLFRIDCSSRHTARIAQGFGWNKICTIPYCRYVKNGEMVFQHIQEPHTEIEVYVDRVNFLEAYHLPYKSYKSK